MTATMILKEIQALPAREKRKLLEQLDRERESAELTEDVRLFDVAEVAGQKTVALQQFLKQAKFKV